MSLEMAHKVIVPQKKNYVPQFLKQRDINSYKVEGSARKFKMRSVPKFLDSVFAKTSTKRSFSLIENERLVLVFAKLDL